MRTSVYISAALISLLAFVLIAFITATIPFGSTENVQEDLVDLVDSKILGLEEIYNSLQSKSNDQIAEEISKKETQALQLFIYSPDNTLKVWSHSVLPTIRKDKWWLESENSRICFQSRKTEGAIVGCEPYDTSKFKTLDSDANAIDYIKQANPYIEFLKFMFLFGFFFFLFVWLKKILLSDRQKFSSFLIAGSTLTASFLFASEKYFDSLNIFNSSNFSSGFILSPASILFGSFFVLLLSLSYSTLKSKDYDTKQFPMLFVIPTFLFALLLKALEFLFKGDSTIQFENVSFEKFALWGYSLGAILLLYSIHLLFQKFAAQLSTQKETKRYTVLASILISYLAFHFILGLDLPWYVILLFLICYYYSLELNSESLSSKLIWSIWFLILNAGLLSSVLYYYTIKKDVRQTQEQLQILYTTKDSAARNQLNALHANILSSEAYKNIHSNRADGKFSKVDLLTYLKSTIPKNYAVKLEDIFLYSPEGESRIINEEKTRDGVLRSYIEKLNPEETILYNPITNKLLLDFKQEEGNLLVCLSENNKQKFTKRFDYGLFHRTQQLSGNLKTLPELNENDIQKNSILNKDGVAHIFHKVNKDKVLYAQKRYSNLLKPISLFSFIFCMSGFFVFLISVLGIYFDLFKSPFLNIASFSSLSTKIQMVIIFLILVSFLAIGIVTSLYFNQILKNNQEKNISAKVISINNSLQNKLAGIDDLQSALNLIENQLPKLSDINSITASFYSKDGLSLHSSDKTKLYPFYPFYQHRAHGKKESYTIQSNNIVSAYFPLTHSVLGTVGYISLDDESYTKDSVKSSISEFLSSMLNLYVFLFFIAGALAIAMSKSITRPLTALQLRLKSIKIGSKNEVIEWEANDEIGNLINSYNDMLVKLEKNVELLAKTERDTAWREMAKQVAHEIKNPLTPMKLSIQYLKRTTSTDPQNSAAMVDKISNTLIEQIDNLAEIANAFSNFATLPQANNDKINLNEVVEVVHDLFRKRDDMEIKLFEPLNAIEVFADKNHMIRILNNLVKNAIQSIPEERKGVISISLYKEEDKAVIKVEDNGKGIPKELQEKVFTPYFTTKTSGTGLGLAISTNMLSAFGGRMYFDTVLNKGTSFYIEIPLMRETYKYHAGEKLILD